MYWMRAIGGTLFVIGLLVLVYNIIMTVRQGQPVEDELAEVLLVCAESLPCQVESPL